MEHPTAPGGTVFDNVPPHFPSPGDNTPTHLPATIHYSIDGRDYERNNPFRSFTDPSGNLHQYTFTGVVFPTLEERRQKARDEMAQFGPESQEQLGLFLECDDQYCSDYETRYKSTLNTMWSDIHPHSYAKWEQCDEMGRPLDECLEIFEYGMKIVKPALTKALETQRMASADPLIGYDGELHESPFWFEGAGEIWRRADHGSHRVKIGECTKLKKEVEQCLLDHHRDGTVDYCYRKFQHSLICEPGFHCPYLRWPMMQCFRRVQGVDYNRFRACVKLVPNYASCKFQPAPQWSLHNNGKFLPDMSEFENPSGKLEFTQFDADGNKLPPSGFYIPEDH